MFCLEMMAIGLCYPVYVINNRYLCQVLHSNLQQKRHGNRNTKKTATLRRLEF
jgi:hypothetical protein